MGRYHRANHASRAARSANTFQVERHERRLRIQTRETYIQRICKAMCRIAVFLRCRESAGDAHPQFVSQLCFTLLFDLAIAQCPFRSCCHSSDCRDIFSAWPPQSLEWQQLRSEEHTSELQSPDHL